MMFVAGLLLLGGVLAVIFFGHLRQTAPEQGLGGQIATLLVFVGLSGAVYTVSGEPDYTRPRLVSEPENIGAALRPEGLAPLEAYGALVLAQSTDQADWLDIATQLRNVRRPVEAADALTRAAALADEPSEQAALFGAAGETLVVAKGGAVDANAVAAFTAALDADPLSLGALFYLGREARLRTDDGAARDYWLRFLEAAPADHPLVAEVRGSLALLGESQEESARIAPVLTPEMIAQFDGLNDEERHRQIVSMLERRRSRLEGLGDTVDAAQWRELARAYVQINELNGAKAAYDRAFQLAPDDKALELERGQLDQP